VACDATFNKQQGVVILCTDSFTAAEVDLLRSILLSKFHIHSTRVAHCKAKEQYTIAKESMATLQSLVGPHMPPTMRYRLGL